MDQAEFDKFADEYRALHAASLTTSGEGPEYFAEYKIREVARELRRHPEQACAAFRILDFGAGTGESVPYVAKHLPGSHLACLDLSRRSLEVAEKRFPSLATYVHFDGAHIPFQEGHFDVAYAMCVFHHIDHAEHGLLLRELHRVLRPGGTLFVFEHNPLNPLTVRVVNRCPFDENAKLIQARAMRRSTLAANFATATIRYRVFFPRSLRALRPLERALGWLPLGGQYYVMARR